MNLLVLDGAGKERAHEVALYASRPENWFRPGESTWTPGDREGHVVQLESFRCVFTYTVAEGSLWRHLSISIPNGHHRNALPQPIAAFTVASWFGFTGGKTEQLPEEKPPPAGYTSLVVDAADDWIVKVHKWPEHPIACVVIVQEIGPA